MIKISATKLRQNLFDYLDKANAGETIVVHRNNREVARLVPVKLVNWRDRMTIKPELRVAPEELLEPIKDIWEGYTDLHNECLKDIRYMRFSTNTFLK